MALTKPLMAVNIITTIGTTAQERAITTDAFKAKFDETPAALKTYLNDVLTAEVDTALAASAELISTHTADLITDSNGVHGLEIEEGTWTPALIGAAAAGSGVTYAEDSGTYYKINKIVVLKFIVTLTNKGTGTGMVFIVDLPFSSGAVAHIGNCVISNYAKPFPNIYNVVPRIQPNISGMIFVFQGEGGQINLDMNDISNTTSMECEITYITT